MYKYLFGPVPSRRLGTSLGVDLVPRKVCSLNCVYCEVGKTTQLTTERRHYTPYGDIKIELAHFFQHNPNPDYITFSGYGEPSLNLGITEVIEFIKLNKPSIPLALLTNGTLFSQKEVRNAVSNIDLVLPSLDAATDTVFRRINRPAAGLSVKQHIQGLVDFRQEYPGIINLEVFILPGYNNHTSELDALKEAILKIQPNAVQLNTLDRPGIVRGIKKATLDELEKIKEYWNLPNTQTIASATQRQFLGAYLADVEGSILETISRRPCTVDDLAQVLGMHINEVNKYLDVLEASQKVTTVQLERGTFYQLFDRK